MRVGMLYTDLTKNALKICYTAHRGQKDAADLPYVFHPVHLAEQMSTEYEICTALLHDVLEDTDYSREDLEDAGFPEEVLDAVDTLTHDRSVPYMEYILSIRKNELARKIKLEDLAHNTDYTRLNTIGPADRTRNRKYRIARALLTPPREDGPEGQAVRSIPMSEDQEYFLALYYDRGCEKKADKDMVRYGILERDNRELLRLELEEGQLFDGSTKVSLLEKIAEFLADCPAEDLPSFLEKHGVSCKKLG